MRAAILSIGDELTLGQTLDTNSAWLAARLAEESIITIEHRTVADDRLAITHSIRQLVPNCDVLLITGGLGPTEDDVTREGLCDALTPKQKLVVDSAAFEHLKTWFAKRGVSMPTMNHKQAYKPQKSHCLPNPHGTALGLARLWHGSCQVFAMPGPAREMQPMFLDHVLPAIVFSSTDDVLLTGIIHEFGMGESFAAERLGQLMERDRNPLVGTTASDSIVSARVRVQAPRDQAQHILDETLDQIERAWHPYVFGRDGESLSQAVGALLQRAGHRLITAESCTGGWLGKAIVDTPGSSKYYHGGWITYSNALKIECLNVSPELIETFGAVSVQVAQAMAQGALAASNAEYSLAITGIAGPDGGTADKPVGTVFIALARKAPVPIKHSSRHFEFANVDRTVIRDRSVKAALQMLRFVLLGIADETPLLWEANRDKENALMSSATDAKGSLT